MTIQNLKLKDLQPSQFYISEKKLHDIEASRQGKTGDGKTGDGSLSSESGEILQEMCRI